MFVSRKWDKFYKLVPLLSFSRARIRNQSDFSTAPPRSLLWLMPYKK
jgi:hypothetical protein